MTRSILAPRRFDRDAYISQINSGLALRTEIESILDKIFEKEVRDIYFVGIGGTLASAMQAETYIQSRCALNVFALSAAVFNCGGKQKAGKGDLFIYSSVSGTTKEMVEMTAKAKEKGITLLAFVDTPDTPLANSADYCVCSPKNEQLKFFMICNYLLKRNGLFPDYDRYNAQMEEYLAKGLADISESFEEQAKAYAHQKCAWLKQHPEMPHYFVAAGTQYGAAVSHGMCYWEEQLWIRTRVVHSAEFFHGLLEVIDENTPVTLFIEEGNERPLSLRVKAFLEKINSNHLFLDSADYPLPGIDEKYRPSVTHLIFRALNDRIDAWLEYDLDHSLDIRRYYRQFNY
ncbi:MAG: SIS domain-containing protein [Erysipelotrichaceae bacterium]|nr:SIS domain-containing protein [Erysipelotrichaceae bacterium]